MLSGTPRSKGLSVPVEKRKYWLLTAMNALNASMPANPRQNGTVNKRQPTAMTAGLGHWHSMVRIGLTLRYLASSVAAAVLTRMTKIATGHPSATAGAMSALLITLLVLAILNTKGEWVYDVTQAVTMGAFVGMSDANVLISSRVPLAGVIAVGYRLLTAPFCEGFAGIEAFCAFLAVATHRVCQPRQESLFERNAAG